MASSLEKQAPDLALSGAQRLLKFVQMRRKYRVRCMVAGAILMVLGLIVPWFVVMFNPVGGALIVSGVTHDQSLFFVDAFNLDKIDISHGWVTITPYNPTLHIGLLATEIAAGITMVLALLTKFDASDLDRGKPWVGVVVRILLKLINVGAIVAFLKLMWWGLVDYHFQDFIRYGVYSTFHGGHFGELVAADCEALPFAGLFVVALGLIVSALGIYTTTATEPEGVLMFKRGWSIEKVARVFLAIIGLLIFFSLVVLLVASQH